MSEPANPPSGASPSGTLPSGIADKLSAALYQREGPLTREMLLAPGGFGLGHIPQGRTPDATTTAVCGFCSTGCGLNVHLRQGEAIGLTPTTRLFPRRSPQVTWYGVISPSCRTTKSTSPLPRQ